MFPQVTAVTIVAVLQLVSCEQNSNLTALCQSGCDTNLAEKVLEAFVGEPHAFMVPQNICLKEKYTYDTSTKTGSYVLTFENGTVFQRRNVSKGENGCLKDSDGNKIVIAPIPTVFCELGVGVIGVICLKDSSLAPEVFFVFKRSVINAACIDAATKVLKNHGLDLPRDGVDGCGKMPTTITIPIPFPGR